MEFSEQILEALEEYKFKIFVNNTLKFSFNNKILTMNILFD